MQIAIWGSKSPKQKLKLCGGGMTTVNPRLNLLHMWREYLVQPTRQRAFLQAQMPRSRNAAEHLDERLRVRLFDVRPQSCPPRPEHHERELDAYASSPIYLSIGVLLSGRGNSVPGKTECVRFQRRPQPRFRLTRTPTGFVDRGRHAPMMPILYPKWLSHVSTPQHSSTRGCCRFHRHLQSSSRAW